MITWKYLFVAYKPESEDICKGCHMGTYSSDFIYLATDDPAEVVEAIVKCLLKNKNLDVNEEGYEQMHLHTANDVTISGEKIWKETEEAAERIHRNNLWAEAEESERIQLQQEQKEKEERKKRYEELKKEFES